MDFMFASRLAFKHVRFIFLPPPDVQYHMDNLSQAGKKPDAPGFYTPHAIRKYNSVQEKVKLQREWIVINPVALYKAFPIRTDGVHFADSQWPSTLDQLSYLFCNTVKADKSVHRFSTAYKRFLAGEDRVIHLCPIGLLEGFFRPSMRKAEKLVW